MSLRVDQANRAVVAASREQPPGGLPDEDEDRIRWSEIDVDSG
jgi:hypothetical protein